MKFAFKKTPAANAGTLQRLSSAAIKERLVSMYSHGGVVIDGVLYHITATGGYRVELPGQWSPEHWDIYDAGGDDAKAREIFKTVSRAPRGRIRQWIWRRLKGYDWFSLLAFVGPLVRVWWLNYCFELMWFMRTGTHPTGRITPEILISMCKDKQEHATQPQPQ